MTDRVIVIDNNGNNVSTINSDGTIYTNSIVNKRVNVRITQGIFKNNDGINNSGWITLFQDVEPGIYSLSCVLETSGTASSSVSFNVQFAGQPLQGSKDKNTNFQYKKDITNMYNLYYYLNNTQGFYIHFTSTSIPTGQSLDVLYKVTLIYIGSHMSNPNSDIVPIQGINNAEYPSILVLPSVSDIAETSSDTGETGSEPGSNHGYEPEEHGSEPEEHGSDHEEPSSP
jgi:hypothetical protein